MEKTLLKRTAALLSSAVLTITFAISSIGPVNAANGKIEKALDWAVQIAQDNTHGYSQKNRQGPDYDCSSLVVNALKKGGISVGAASYTGNMKSELTQNGFTWIPWSQISGTQNLQRGDILLRIDHHTEFYLGNNQNVAAHSDRGNPQTGDQDGTEISVGAYWYDYWDGVLRYQSSTVVTTNPIKPSGCFPACSSSYSSIVNALSSIGVDSSFTFRSKIAAYNGITNYSGTAEQNTKMLNLLKAGTLKDPRISVTTTATTRATTRATTVTTKPQQKSGCFPPCSSSYTSLVDALYYVGADYSYSYRQKIASANGISNYSGTAEQNTNLLNMLKAGLLKKPDIVTTNTSSATTSKITTTPQVMTTTPSITKQTVYVTTIPPVTAPPEITDIPVNTSEPLVTAPPEVSVTTADTPESLVTAPPEVSVTTADTPESLVTALPEVSENTTSISTTPVTTTNSAVVTTGTDTISSDTVKISIDNVKAKAGDTIYVPVLISENCGINYLKLSLSYDNTALKLVSATNTDLLNNFSFQSSENSSVNPYIMVWSSASPSTANGKISVLEFKVSDTASENAYEIKAKCSGCFNENDKNVSAEIKDGNITVINQTETGKIEIDQKSIKVEFPENKFYYSHDDQFDLSGLKFTAVINSETVDLTADMSIKNLTPSKVYNGKDLSYRIPLVYTGSKYYIPDNTYFFTVYIGKKGDVSLDNSVNTYDAKLVMNESGSAVFNDTIIPDIIKRDNVLDGQTVLSTADPDTIADFARFLGNVDENSILDTSDAVYILKYNGEYQFANINSWNTSAEWSKILSQQI